MRNHRRNLHARATPMLVDVGFGRQGECRAVGFNNTALMLGNQQALARWMRVLVELTQEVAQFTQRRLHEDMAGWTALGACRKPEEFFECNRRLTAAAADQYSAEFRNLSELVTQAAGEALVPPQVAQASGHTQPKAPA